MQSWSSGRLSRRHFLKLAALLSSGLATLSMRGTAQSASSTPVRMGVVLPIPTGTTAETDVLGSAAQAGAELADGLVGTKGASLGLNLKVLFSSSPTAAAARRAGERMAATEGVVALVGGVGPGQAEALAKVAADRDLLFFNVGATDSALRGSACSRNMFHIEASDSMYLDAITSYFGSLGQRRWFTIYPDTDRGKALYVEAGSAFARVSAGAADAGSAAVQPGPQAYSRILKAVSSADPDAVLVLLNAPDQDFFLGQYQAEGLSYPVVGFPSPLSQTRQYYARFVQSAPQAGGLRAALWDPTLSDGDAQTLSERFAGQNGSPMDPVAWATFVAIKIAVEAVASVGTLEGSVLGKYLESPGARFHVYKRADASFRPWDHQLRQELYIVKLDASARPGTSFEDQLSLASVVTGVPELEVPPADVDAALDRLGVPASATECHFGA